MQAFFAAAETDDIIVLTQQLTAGVDTASVDAQGRTALHVASVSGSVLVVQKLCELQHTKHLLVAQDTNGRTPLMCAALGGHAEVAAALLAAPPVLQTLEVADADGNTALFIATKNGQPSALHCALCLVRLCIWQCYALCVVYFALRPRCS